MSFLCFNFFHDFPLLSGLNSNPLTQPARIFVAWPWPTSAASVLTRPLFSLDMLRVLSLLHTGCSVSLADLWRAIDPVWHIRLHSLTNSNSLIWSQHGCTFPRGVLPVSLTGSDALIPLPWNPLLPWWWHRSGTCPEFTLPERFLTARFWHLCTDPPSWCLLQGHFPSSLIPEAQFWAWF